MNREGLQGLVQSLEDLDAFEELNRVVIKGCDLLDYETAARRLLGRRRWTLRGDFSGRFARKLRLLIWTRFPCVSNSSLSLYFVRLKLTSIHLSRLQSVYYSISWVSDSSPSLSSLISRNLNT